MLASLMNKIRRTSAGPGVVPFWAARLQRASDCARVHVACICTRLGRVGNLVSSPLAQVLRHIISLLGGVSRYARNTFGWLTSYVERIIHFLRRIVEHLQHFEKPSLARITEHPRLQQLLHHADMIGKGAIFAPMYFRSKYANAVEFYHQQRARLTALLSGFFAKHAALFDKVRGTPTWINYRLADWSQRLAPVESHTEWSREFSVFFFIRSMFSENMWSSLYSLLVFHHYGSRGWESSYWKSIVPTLLIEAAVGSSSPQAITFNAILEEVMLYHNPSPWLTTWEQIINMVAAPEAVWCTILGHKALDWLRARSVIASGIVHCAWNLFVHTKITARLMLIPEIIRLKYKHGELIVKAVADQIGCKIEDGAQSFTTGSNSKPGQGHAALACQNSACYALAAHNARAQGKRLFDIGSGPRAWPMVDPSARVHFNTPNVIRGDPNRQKSVANAIRSHAAQYPLYAGFWTQCKCPLRDCTHHAPDDFMCAVHSAYYLTPDELAIIAAHENLVFCHPLPDAFGKYEGGYHITDGTRVKMLTLSNGSYEAWEHAYPDFLHGTVPVGNTFVTFVSDSNVPSFVDTVCGQIEFTDEDSPMQPFSEIDVAGTTYFGRSSFATRDLKRVMPYEALVSLQSFVVGKNPSQLGVNSFLAHLRSATTLSQPEVLEAFGDMHHYTVSREAANAEEESINTHLNTAVANYTIGASRDHSFSVLHYLKARLETAFKRLLMWLVRFKFIAWIARWFQRKSTLSAVQIEQAYGSYLDRKRQVIDVSEGIYKVDSVVEIPTSELTPKPIETRINLNPGTLVLPSGNRKAYLAGIQAARLPIYPSSSSANQLLAMERQVMKVPQITEKGVQLLIQGYDSLFSSFPSSEEMKVKWDPEKYYEQYVSERPQHERKSMLNTVLSQPGKSPAAYNTFVKYEATKTQDARPRNISADSESCKVIMGPIARFYSEIFKLVWAPEPDNDKLYFCGRSSEELSEFLLTSGMFDVDEAFNYKDVVVLEIDQSKYDSHVSLKAKHCEINFLDKICERYLGAVPVENQYLRAILTQKFKSSCGIRFEDPDSRASGSSMTTTGNSSLSFAMLATIFSTIRCKMAVIGDDSLVVIKKRDWVNLFQTWGADPLQHITAQYKEMGFTVDLILRENLAATTFCSGRFYPVLGRLKFLYGQMIGRQLTKMGVFSCAKKKLPGVLFGASIANRICFSHIPILNDINECLFAECQARADERKIQSSVPDEYKHRISPKKRHHQTDFSIRFVQLVYSFTEDEISNIFEILQALAPSLPGKVPNAQRLLQPTIISSDLLLRIITQDLDL